MIDIVGNLSYVITFEGLDYLRILDIFRILGQKSEDRVFMVNANKICVRVLNMSDNEHRCETYTQNGVVIDSISIGNPEYWNYFKLRAGLELFPSRFETQEEFENSIDPKDPVTYYCRKITKEKQKELITELWNEYRKIVDNYKFTEEEANLISLLKTHDSTKNFLTKCEWTETTSTICY